MTSLPIETNTVPFRPGGFEEKLDSAPTKKEESPPRVHYSNFDVLRLFLALSVPVWHINAQLHLKQWALPFLAVPSFLAISGFVILQSWRSSVSPLHFWVKRATRLLPCFFLSLGLVAVLFGYSGMHGALLTYLKVGTMNSMASKNPPLWTLSAEECIYIALSFIAAFITRRRLAFAVAIVVPTYLVLGGYLGWNERYVDLIPAFILGLYARESGYRIPLGPVIPVIVAVLLSVWINAFGHQTTLIWSIWALSSMVAVLELGRMKWQPLKGKRFLDISYAVYIVQYPIIFALMPLHLPPSALFASVFALTLTLSYAASKMIERPAINAREMILRTMSGIFRSKVAPKNHLTEVIDSTELRATS